MCGIDLSWAKNWNFDEKEGDGSNLCGINLSWAKNENFHEKEGDGSNLCGMNLRKAKNLKCLWKRGRWVKSVRNKSKLS